MTVVRRPVLVAAVVGIAVWLVATGAACADDVNPAVPGPTAQLRSEQRLSPIYAQGVARVPHGWVVSGTNVLARLDDSLRVRVQVTPAIPAVWKAKGYDHIGDIDVVGSYVYAPFEQPDYSLGHQATARYDARTLAFVDAIELPQHENSFVTVDPATMVAYSMDHFDGNALLRYDVRRHWAPMSPLTMDRLVQRVQGADVARGAVWLSTDDAQHGIYRVDLRSGAVDELGSSGHLGGNGEGEGIDASPVGSALLHVQTVDPTLVPVWLSNFAVVGASRSAAAQVAEDVNHRDTAWPPVLVAGVVGFAVAVLGASIVLYRRARLGLRRPR